MNGQRRALRAGKRPCNRDYRSRQSAAPLANSGRSRCQTARRTTSTFAEAVSFGVELRHARTSTQPRRFTRAALLPASWRSHRQSGAHAHICQTGRNLCRCLSLLDHSVPPACSAEGWPTAG
jgi:hypothetical protein